MKKLYFVFILIFGFLAFVPQIALGDSAVSSQKIMKKIKEDKAKALACVHNRKANFPTKYEGQNLKLQYLPHYGRESLPPTTNIEYFIDPASFLKLGKPPAIKELEEKPYKTNSIANAECSEYVIIPFTGYIPIVYYVGDVPPNSYLKYIPETSEMQVITPTDKEYKKFMAEYKKQEKMQKNKN